MYQDLALSPDGTTIARRQAPTADINAVGAFLCRQLDIEISGDDTTTTIMGRNGGDKGRRRRQGAIVRCCKATA